MRMLSVDQIQDVRVYIFLYKAKLCITCVYMLHTYTHIFCLLQQLANVSDGIYLQILNSEILLLI